MHPVVPKAKAPRVPEGILKLCPVRPTEPRVLKVLAEIEEMLRERDVASECARRAGLSESRLSHLFKAATGWTLRDYRSGVRLEVGRQLLASSSLSIKEIAAQVGMSPTHFSRAFKAALGRPPRAYRLGVRGNLPSDRQLAAQHPSS
jgi:AraC family transcriptional regulator of arabinose operon